MTARRQVAIRRGTGNVFADLNIPDAENHLLKAQLVVRLSDILSERNLTQTEAARILGLSQPDVSRLLRGQFRDVSVERLMRMLVKLGCAVDIVVKQKGKKSRLEPIHLEPV
ncbi:MAG: helix-turn-helix domain-containing protein [Rhizomicrobium sp.]